MEKTEVVNMVIEALVIWIMNELKSTSDGMIESALPEMINAFNELVKTSQDLL